MFRCRRFQYAAGPAACGNRQAAWNRLQFRRAIAIEEFEEIFQEENYERLPECMQEAVEQRCWGIKNKDILEIDYAIDRAQALWRISDTRNRQRIWPVHVPYPHRSYNLRTLMRLKSPRDESTYFLHEGFVERDRFVQGLDLNYDSLAALFLQRPILNWSRREPAISETDSLSWPSNGAVRII